MPSVIEAPWTSTGGASAAAASGALVVALFLGLGAMATGAGRVPLVPDVATRAAADGNPSTWTRTREGLPAITVRTTRPVDVVAVRVLAAPGERLTPTTTRVSFRARLADGGERHVQSTLVEAPTASRWREVAFEADALVELTLEAAGAGATLSVAEIELVGR